MSDILIDAPLLSCPSPDNLSQDDFQDAFLEYLKRLADLSMLRSNLPSVRFWRDEELALILHENECYPFRHSLAHAFASMYNSLDYQLEDANTLANALLEKSLRLEDYGDIADVVVTSCHLTNDPVQNRDASLTNYLCRLICLALPILGDGKNFNQNSYLASSASINSAKKIKAAYEVNLLEKKDGVYETDLPPSSIDLKNYRGYKDLVLDIDILTLWAAPGMQSSIDACALTVEREKDSFSAEVFCELNISFGSKFFDSAKPLGFLHDLSKMNKLLKVICDLIIGRNLSHSHWLRTGAGPNDPQRSKADWKAWRHDIDYEFHLHYWKNGNSIQFSNVVVHNDFCIY